MVVGVMTPAAPRNKITIYRGTAPKIQFTVDPDSVPDGDPVSGWSTKYTIRQTAATEDESLQVSGSWNSSNETVDVSMTRAQTLTLAAGRYLGALFRITGGSEDELSRDEITVIESIYDPPLS